MTADTLRAMIEATPLPEATDIDTLLADFAAMHDRRQAIIDAITGPLPVSDEDRALLQTLHEREAAWQDALAAARDRVRDQRIGTTKLRSYAPSL
jgi:hypothetical protein